MSDIETNRRVALDFCRAMSTNDTALADACLHPEAIAVARGFGKFAGTRPREVMVGTIDAFARILPTGLRLAPRTVLAEGDRVMVECEGDGVTCEGTAYANHYVFLFTMKDGLVARIDEYFCNVLANEVLWPLVAAEGERLAAG